MEADSKQAGTPAHEKQKLALIALETHKKEAMIESGKYRIAACLPIRPFVDGGYGTEQALADYEAHKAATAKA